MMLSVKKARELPAKGIMMESNTLNTLDAVFSRNFLRLKTVAMIIATSTKAITANSNRYCIRIRSSAFGYKIIVTHKRNKIKD